MNLIIQVSDWYSQDWIYYPKNNYTFADSLHDYNMKRLLLGLQTTLKLELIPEEPHFLGHFQIRQQVNCYCSEKLKIVTALFSDVLNNITATNIGQYIPLVCQLNKEIDR